jgi:hypothetical protein
MSDLNKHPTDDTPEAWRDWTPERFALTRLIDETRQLLVLVNNLFASRQHRLDMTPAYRPGNTPPGFQESETDSGIIVLKHLF